MSPVSTNPASYPTENLYENGHRSNGHLNGNGFINGDKIKKNLALVVTEDHQIYMKDLPFPVPRADEAVVHVKATGSVRPLGPESREPPLLSILSPFLNLLTMSAF